MPLRRLIPGTDSWADRTLYNSRYEARKRGYAPPDISKQRLLSRYAIHHRCCDICGIGAAENKRALALDHDHVTGKVRGWLCDNCNRGIGHLKDSPVLMQNAIDYLLL